MWLGTVPNNDYLKGKRLKIVPEHYKRFCLLEQPKLKELTLWNRKDIKNKTQTHEKMEIKSMEERKKKPTEQKNMGKLLFQDWFQT